MKKNYKKGDALFVRYTKTNHTDIFETVGILLKISSVKIELGHNFKETNPIDLTTIPTKKINYIKQTVPKEIKSLKDLN